MTRPYPWEASYPPVVDWGAAIATSTLTTFFDRIAAQFREAPALRYRGARVSYAGLQAYGQGEIGVPDAYRGQSAKAFVVLREGASLSFAALKLFLAERVGRHEIPTALEIRESLPTTPVGKLSRRALLEPIS